MNVNVATVGASAVVIVWRVANHVEPSVLNSLVPVTFKHVIIAMSLCAPIAGVNLEVKKPQCAHLIMKGYVMNVGWTWL